MLIFWFIVESQNKLVIFCDIHILQTVLLRVIFFQIIFKISIFIGNFNLILIKVFFKLKLWLKNLINVVYLEETYHRIWLIGTKLNSNELLFIRNCNVLYPIFNLFDIYFDLSDLILLEKIGPGFIHDEIIAVDVYNLCVVSVDPWLSITFVMEFISIYAF